ncbi:MAG: VOC family protein [Chloroflexota bacterium]|nr:VOC family protein [Dehalococcoidia bacterium]MDW8253124.1 VOC family protein [Chloroflexota bacterium]
MTARLLGGIDQVCVGAQDLEATTRFFVDGLGLHVVDEGQVGGAGYAALWGIPADRALRLRVVGHPAVPRGRVRIAEALLPAPPPTMLTDLGIFDVDFLARDLDGICARVREAGFSLWSAPLAYQIGAITVREAIAEPPDGLRSALIQDTGSASALRDQPHLAVSEAVITAVGVDDVERGLAFYRAAFGLAPLRVFDIRSRELNALLLLPGEVALRVALLDMPPARLELIQVVDGPAPCRDIRPLQRPPRAGFQGNAYWIADLDDAVAACVTAGARLLAGPVALPADVLSPRPRRTVLLVDPVGTVLELSERRG